MISRSIKLSATVLAIFAVSSFAAHQGANSVSADAVGRIVRIGDMAFPRFDHTATLLPNGKVLIAAGMARNGVIEPSAELYDPRMNRFTFVGKLTSPRGWGSTATLLRDGKVLITGGASGSWCSDTCYLATAELYDPATVKFTPTGNMTVPRAAGTTGAILMSSGDVLIVGGNLGPAPTTELYHPSTGAFSPTGKPSEGAGILLPLHDGRVLALGSSGAQIYDPSTGQFTPAGDFPVPYGKFGAALLPNGNVLVAGGQVDGAWGPRIDTTQIYNVQTQSFTSGPMMNFTRFKLRKGIVALRNGDILVAGGADHPEIYDASPRRFLPVPGATLDAYSFSTATLLTNGEVLIVGGYGRPQNGAVNHAWLYQPAGWR